MSSESSLHSSPVCIPGQKRKEKSLRPNLRDERLLPRFHPGWPRPPGHDPSHEVHGIESAFGGRALPGLAAGGPRSLPRPAEAAGPGPAAESTYSSFSSARMAFYRGIYHSLTQLSTPSPPDPYAKSCKVARKPRDFRGRVDAEVDPGAAHRLEQAQVVFPDCRMCRPAGRPPTNRRTHSNVERRTGIAAASRCKHLGKGTRPPAG